ncbi:MAG: thermonuclease family protein [Alphaproteobacteria bacterium]|nr:thermonuclease family protein [Alphaproteobacteria bacterium]
MRFIVLALAALLAVAAPGAVARERIQVAGAVSHVRDGDTIEVAGVALRLEGLHAPELREPGGGAARDWMVAHTAGQPVVCELTGARSFDRRVAVCRNADGDLASQLIAAGLGRDCPRFSAGRYAAYETAAGRALALPRYCVPRLPPSSTARP